MKTASLRVAGTLMSALSIGVACAGPPSRDDPAASADERTLSSYELRVAGLRTEYRVNPLGIDVEQPRFDWQLLSEAAGKRQTAYRILVASTREALADNRGDLWDSGKVSSDETTQISYVGARISSRQRAWWKVRVWDEKGTATAWSETAWWERALSTGDWQAKWIASSTPAPTLNSAQWIWFPEGDPVTSAPAGERYFRKSFTLPAGANITAATCIMTVDDEFELFVNGTSLGYAKRWEDVKRFNFEHLLTPGTNVLAVRAVNTSQSPAGLLARADIAFTTGASSSITFTSDASWKASASSSPAWSTALFDDSAWPSAKALAAYGGGPWGKPKAGSAPVYLRTDFRTEKPKRARIYATALGVYEVWLNGQKVGDEYLTPGFTDYRQRLQVQTYDVTALLADGDNALGAVVADGWYNGKVGFVGRGDHFGAGPNRALVQLEIERHDGTRTIVASNDTWKSHEGPIVAADLLDGEVYDARNELDGWSTAHYDDGAWPAVQVIPNDAPSRALVADVTAGVRSTQELTPVSVQEMRPGVFLFDLGQNMVGRARLRVQGARGSTLQLRFGEVLNPDGTLYTDNLRGAKATDVYTLRGGAEEIFDPHFTTHGFRYVELSGDTAALAKKPDASTITGVVLHSYMTPSGAFATSSSLINRLQSNIVWGQRGNFVSVPTDCPQRDERLGWLGDAQVFARTSTFNMDVASFFTKWTRDVDDAQSPNGAFPDFAPSFSTWGSTPAWGDAGVIVPWTMYLAYGDTRILREHYAAMVRWVEHIRTANPDFLWRNQRGSDYGDWLSIDADTDKEVLATAFYAHSVDLVARIARILGEDADAHTYGALFASIKDAFKNAYVGADGTVRSNTQTVYALALRFELLPENLRSLAASHLMADVEARGHLSTGFVGVAHLLPVLTAYGRVDLAYRLLNTDTFPSWLYSVNKGATTIWERWDGIRPNGQFQDPGMNSFNHYSLGSVGEWMYATIAGIELDEAHPGYKHFFVRPRPGGGLESASGKLDTIHGTIVSDWKIAGRVFSLNVTVPPNTTATVSVPFGGGERTVASGQYTFAARLPDGGP
ncbi:glycoside hydrolase family 78 protein [Pendulispora brunnea]|uniref:alpha-L-rhamnosidase n=1 Tax=Pendulispora brunnea TaxID=2905690 RepID=A0ABZ2KA00_9BACT